MPTSSKNPSLSNQSSEKLLSLIELLSKQEEPARLSDLAASLHMNASTVLRFLTTLQNREYVFQDPDTGRYSLTYKICSIANNVTSRLNLRNICAPYLQQISKTFGCTTNLIVRYNYSCIYLEVIASPQQIMIPLQRIGRVAPLYCTGAGKLLLEEFSETQLEEYARDVEFKRFTEKTICTLPELKEVIAQSRVNGYSIDDEECELGTRCLAVPVYDYTGHIIAVISINAAATRLTDSYILEIAPSMKAIVAEVSKKLGYSETDSV